MASMGRMAVFAVIGSVTLVVALWIASYLSHTAG
jgi:hypothetical protein